MAKISLSHSLARGQKHTLTIASLAPGGEGVSRELGPPVFVNRVAPGDLVEVELFDVRKDFARGRVVNLVRPSAERREPPCPLFKVCGGCQWQHLLYAAQLRAKEEIVRQAVKHIGGLTPELVRPIIPAAETLHYRNKVQFPVESPRGSNRILAGYYRQDSHELVNIKHCPIQPEPLDEVLRLVKERCEANGISAYDEGLHEGVLRHINIRYSFSERLSLVTLVLNCRADTFAEFESLPLFGKIKRVCDQLLDASPIIAGVTVNLNSQPGNKILGRHNFLLGGRDHLFEVLATERNELPDQLKGGIKYSLSAASFFQVNTWQAVKLLETIFDFCFEVAGKLGRRPVIVDAYSGVGTMSLWLACMAERIVAVEENPEALADAQRNLVLNDIENVEIRGGKVEDELPQLVREGLVPDIVIIDPPRKGVMPSVLQALMDLQAATIVYVSCNPATLARDLRILEHGVPHSEERKTGLSGYKTKQVQPIDLFPETYHVESVSIIETVEGEG